MKRLTESEIIYHLKHGRGDSDQVEIPIGDDAALINFNNPRVMICKDVSVEGVHFLKNTDPFYIARRSVLVNVSDLAAMASTPKYLLLGLTLPKIYSDELWVKRFAKGIHSALDEFDLHLVGGDVARGKLNVSVTLIGEESCPSKPLRRSGVRPDHNIYVTGTLGDAAAGLEILKRTILKKNSQVCYLVKRYQDPTARLKVSKEIATFAGGAIDVSDGLINELGILSKQSQCSIMVDASLIPISRPLKKIMNKTFLGLALYGGDDYEILFSAPPGNEKLIKKISKETNTLITLIGRATPGKGIELINYDIHEAKPKGFKHF